MKNFSDEQSHVLVFERGQELISGLQKFMTQNPQVQAVWLHGLGGATQIELGFYDLQDQKYYWKMFDGLYEITNLQGNISRDKSGEPLLHIHGTFADREYRAFGGHLRRLIVGGTCEIGLKILNIPLTRHRDDATGLMLLDQKS